MTYKLQKKPDPDNIVEEKKKVKKVIKNLTKLSENPDIEYFDVEISNLINNNFASVIEIYEQYIKENGEPEDEDVTMKYGQQTETVHQRDNDDKEEIFVPWKEPEVGSEEWKK